MPRDTIGRLIAEAEEERSGLCTQFDGCWHCRVLRTLRVLERRTANYADDPVFTAPTDASNEAIFRAATDTASRLGLFAATWPEFYAFGLAVKAALESPPATDAVDPVLSARGTTDGPRAQEVLSEALTTASPAPGAER